MSLGGAMSLTLLALTATGVADAIGFATVAGWFCASPVIAFILLLVAVPHLSGARYTDAGRRVGTYWLGVAGWLAAHEDLADLPPPKLRPARQP
jgi:hypothetical protein